MLSASCRDILNYVPAFLAYLGPSTGSSSTSVILGCGTIWTDGTSADEPHFCCFRNKNKCLICDSSENLIHVNSLAHLLELFLQTEPDIFQRSQVSAGSHTCGRRRVRQTREQLLETTFCLLGIHSS